MKKCKKRICKYPDCGYYGENAKNYCCIGCSSDHYDMDRLKKGRKKMSNVSEKKSKGTGKSVDMKSTRQNFFDAMGASRLEMKNFFDEGMKKSAGLSRKYLQEVRKLAQELRLAIQEKKKSM